MPDAVGNLFRTTDRSDREYGPAGQVLRALDDQGRWVTYDYDPEGSLTAKTADDGEHWEYRWHADGNMASVLRPDGTQVAFTYDALSRRVTKAYRGQTTHWVWDGDVILHEWVEEEPLAPPATDGGSSTGVAQARDALLTEVFRRGPPDRGTVKLPITWLFDPGSFALAAHIRDNRSFSFVTDHLGTPIAQLNPFGDALLDLGFKAHGQALVDVVQLPLTPARFPGQYEDYETGLFYNRHRYYDPTSGQYISTDPIRLAGGTGLARYVKDPSSMSDPLGLTEQRKRCAADHADTFDTTTLVADRSPSPTLQAGGRSFIYGNRVLARAREARDSDHNFPYSFDDEILTHGTRTEVSEAWTLYTRPGRINGQDGIYEIGARPSGLADAEVINHRFFRRGG
jgi:RHS repeat-associated protein